MRALALLPVALALAVSCAKPSSTGASGPQGASARKPDAGPSTALDPKTVVGSVNEQPITAGDVDAKIKGEYMKATQEYVQRVHEMRNEALESMVAEKLVDLEAKARGITREQLVSDEIEKKAPPPTDEKIREAYDKYLAGRSPYSFEEAKPRLAEQLHQQEQAMRAKAFFDELKVKYKASTNLPAPEVPRVEVAATGPSKGPEKAPVTIVAFSDFECPFCSRAVEPIDQVTKTYGDKVRVVFRQFPLSFHPKAKKAAEASLCAHDQGKFWEMHDALFKDQSKLAEADLKATARTLGVDGEKFDKCLDSGEKSAQVEKDLQEGQAAGVNGTPAFFINGKPLSGAQPFEAFKQAIDAELAQK